MVASTTLLLLDVPLVRVVQKVREQRNSHYRLLRESFAGHGGLFGEMVERQDRLRTVALPARSANAGQPLASVMNDGIVVTALVREGVRRLNPDAQTLMAGEDILVLFGSPEDLDRAERALLR